MRSFDLSIIVVQVNVLCQPAGVDSTRNKILYWDHESAIKTQKKIKNARREFYATQPRQKTIHHDETEGST